VPKPNPLKRHKSIQPVSREHHHGLLLCWKIKEGFKQQIAIERMKKYADWFWTHHLQPHFLFEEKYMFPILEIDHSLITRALNEHARLKELFNTTEGIEHSLTSIEEELAAHIRFEERELFQEIQAHASLEQLTRIEQAHSTILSDHWEDEFWVGPK